MRYARLGRSDLEVSVVGLGCGNFGGVGSSPDLFGRGDDEAAAVALMDAARERGVTLFDTANSYGGGRSEEWIGRWLASRSGARGEIVLTTKVRNAMAPGQEGLSAVQIRTQIEASLRRLRTDHVDLYLAHEPDADTPIHETMSAFEELVKAGKVGHVGLSNYTADEVVAALDAHHAVPVNLQSSYSLLDRVAAGDAFDVCARHGLGFTAFSPLAGGWLSGKYQAGEPYPAGSRMTLRPEPYAGFTRPDTYTLIGALQHAADARGLPLATLALAWVLTDPGVTAAIVGPRTPAQLDLMCAAVDVDMTPDERAALMGA